MPAGYGHIRYAATLKLLRTTIVAILLIAYSARAEPSPECQSAIERDMAAGAVIDTQLDAVDPDRTWLKKEVAGREATIIHDCEPDVWLRTVHLKFSNVAAAMQYFEERRDALFLVEGGPSYEADGVTPGDPGIVPAPQQLRPGDVLVTYRWEREGRFFVLSLSKENDEEWGVLLGAGVEFDEK
jgi:hypothetical protein